MRIDPNAGTRSVVEIAAAARTRPPGVSAPPQPVDRGDESPPHNDVGQLFQVVAGLRQALQASFDGAEQRRVAGQEGMDDSRVRSAVADAKQNLQSLLEKTSNAGRSSRSFIAALEEAISSGESSTHHLDKKVRALQEDLAEQFGFSGHLLDRWA